MLTSHFCARAESYMTQVCEVAHRPHMYPICPQRNVSIERALHQAMPSASDWIRRCLLAMNHQMIIRIHQVTLLSVGRDEAWRFGCDNGEIQVLSVLYIYIYSISYSVFHIQGCKMQIDKLVNLKEVNLSQFQTLEVGG